MKSWWDVNQSQYIDCPESKFHVIFIWVSTHHSKWWWKSESPHFSPIILLHILYCLWSDLPGFAGWGVMWCEPPPPARALSDHPWCAARASQHNKYQSNWAQFFGETSRMPCGIGPHCTLHCTALYSSSLGSQPCQVDTGYLAASSSLLSTRAQPRKLLILNCQKLSTVTE